MSTSSNRLDDDIRDPSADRRSRHIPHSVFGIGLVALLLLAALVLMVLSGDIVRSSGPVILLLAGVPLMIGLAIVAGRRWRRARRGTA